MIKTLKEEISSDDVFHSDETETATNLFTGNGLFIKFWMFQNPEIQIIPFTMAPLPGYKKGVSAASLSGYNLGIANNLDEETKNAAIIAFKFLTSKEIQRKFVKENLITSAILSLYDEEEICKNVDCNLNKRMQPIVRPNKKTNDYNTYSEQYRNYIYEFIYGKKSAEEALLNVNDITEIDYYYLSLGKGGSKLGLIMFIIQIIIGVLMALSIIFLFKDNYNVFFKFLAIDFWIFVILGCLVILSLNFTRLGKLSTIKCHLKPILLSYGYTLNFIPFLYKLIKRFPDDNLFSDWVKKHKYLFFISFLLIDCILSGLSFLIPYEVRDMIVKEGRNFQTCFITNTFGKIFFILMVIYKLAITIILLILIFIEWNIESTVYDVRFTVTAIYIDFLSVIILVLLNLVTITNYIIYVLI